MRSILRAPDVVDVGPPPSRVASARQPLASAAPHGRWVLVAVRPISRRVVPEQPVAAGRRVRSVEHEDLRPATSHRSQIVLADPWVSRPREADPLNLRRTCAARAALVWSGAGCVVLAARTVAARARQALAVPAVAVRIARVGGALRLGLRRVVGARRRRPGDGSGDRDGLPPARRGEQGAGDDARHQEEVQPAAPAKPAVPRDRPDGEVIGT